MAAPDAINSVQLSRLIGTADAPRSIDVRMPANITHDGRTLPGSIVRDPRSVAVWARDFAGQSVVVVCQRGYRLSQGVAAWLRQTGSRAEYLDGGFDAWVHGNGMPIRPDHVPARNAQGGTVWVTRARPKIDRIACPWLIRRFVDPDAMFLFVAAGEVAGVAEQFAATPFDIEGVFWSHRGEACTFDVMMAAFGVRPEPLERLAMIVRAAGTARLDLAPEAAGLLAASLGFRACIETISPDWTPQ